MGGLGRAIIVFFQPYVTAPEKLWATILIASRVGIDRVPRGPRS